MAALSRALKVVLAVLPMALSQVPAAPAPAPVAVPVSEVSSVPDLGIAESTVPIAAPAPAAMPVAAPAGTVPVAAAPATVAVPVAGAATPVVAAPAVAPAAGTAFIGAGVAGVATPAPAAQTQVQQMGNQLADNLFGKVGDGVEGGGMMSTMLSAVGATQGMSGGGTPGENRYPNRMGDVMQGAVTSFFKGDNVTLTPTEIDCLSRGLGGVSTNTISAGYALVDLVKALMTQTENGPGNDNHAMGAAMFMKPALIGAAIKAATSTTGLVSDFRSLITGCFADPQTEAVMQVAMANMRNFPYMKQRFAQSGVDVAELLSASIVAWDGKDWNKCGRKLGSAARLVVLSNKMGSSPLPQEEVDQLTEDVMEGAMGGFFPEGSSLTITDSLDSRVSETIDLQRCIVDNHKEFEDIFEGAFGGFMKLSSILPVPHPGGGMAPAAPMPMDVSSDVSANWQSELMMSVVGFPALMARCNLGLEKMEMFKEAMKTPKGLHFKFQFPQDDDIGARDVTRNMAEAIRDYGDGHYKSFGKELGRFGRQVIFLAGKPQAGLDRLYATFEGDLIAPEEAQAEKLAPQALSVSAMYGGIAMMFLLVIMVVRVVRPFRATSSAHSSLEDAAVEAELLEAGDAEEMHMPVE